MVNYENGIIYKLCCKDSNIKDIYIGSTTNFRLRKYSHKNICNNKKSKHYNYHVYKFIRENGDFENWDMVLIEKVNCKDKKELESKEREWFDKLKPTLNSQKPQNSWKQYYEENKEKIKLMAKIKGVEYRKNNKEKIRIRDKKYREKNRDKINKKNSISASRKIQCICSDKVFIRRDSRSKHFKSKKHRKLIAEIKRPLHEELLN